MNNDTILLLKECDSGLKMAISSLDEVLDVIKNQKFKEICITSKNKHQTLKNEVDHLLKEHHLQEKEPSLLAKSMSWLKMNFKIQMNEDDQTIASLLFEGCSMGIETLYKYFEAAVSIVVLDEVLYFYRETENSVLNATNVQGRLEVMKDDITSIVHQMTFFRDNGYTEAYRRGRAFLYRQALYFVMFVRANDLSDEGEQYNYCLRVLTSFKSEIKYVGLKWYVAIKLYQLVPNLLLACSKNKFKVY